MPTESYLKFNVNAYSQTAGNAFRWDSCGAHGLIQRIRVFHGSNLICDIDSYNMLAKMLYDIQMPSDAVYGKFNVLSGTRNDLTLACPTIAGADVPATIISVNNALKGISVLSTNSGDRIDPTGVLLTAVGNVTNPSPSPVAYNQFGVGLALANIPANYSLQAQFACLSIYNSVLGPSQITTALGFCQQLGGMGKLFI